MCRLCLCLFLLAAPSVAKIRQLSLFELVAGIGGFAAAARAFGKPRLAEELEAVFATNDDDLPEGYTADRDWSFRT